MRSWSEMSTWNQAKPMCSPRASWSGETPTWSVSVVASWRRSSTVPRHGLAAAQTGPELLAQLGGRRVVEQRAGVEAHQVGLPVARSSPRMRRCCRACARRGR